jgi:uncharacterized membrane protein YeaQ/YmgE (transglycosylase-associated protein family)
MNLENLIVLVLIATLCAFVAERMTRRDLPFGLIGTMIAGLLGAWVLVEMFHWRIPGDMVAGGIPVLTAFLGAVAVIFVSSTLAGDRLHKKGS